MAVNANLKAEAAILGGLMRSPGDYWRLADMVKADHFTSPLHRDIYNAISAICESSGKMSVTAVAARLPEETEDGHQIVPILASLFASAEDTGSPLDYAERVAEDAAKRRLLRVAQAITKAVGAGEKAAVDIASDVGNTLTDILQMAAPRRPRHFGQIVSEVASMANSAWKNLAMPGVTTGFASIDEILGAMMPGDLGFLLASQGDGKSALAAKIAIHVARTGPVLFIESDMTGEGVAVRAVAARAKVRVREIEQGNFDTFAWDEITKAKQELQTPDLWLLDERKLTVRQVRAHAMAMKRTRGLRLLVIDHLGKLKSDGRHRDRFERLAEVTGDLKDLAKEIEAPVFCLVQRTRGAQRREDPTPQVHDSDAPSIEQDADFILALWRKWTWLQNNKPAKSANAAAWEIWKDDLAKSRDVANIMMLKGRSMNPYEERTLGFNGPLTDFYDI